MAVHTMKKINIRIDTYHNEKYVCTDRKSILRAVTAEFVNNYNQGNFENIFDSYSAEMQIALTIDKIIEFLTGLKSQAGKI